MNKLVTYLFSSLKNNNLAYKKKFKIIYSKSVFDLCNLLYKHGYINNFKHVNNKIEINLKYLNNVPNIFSVTSYSKSGRRIYISCDNLLNNYNLNDFVILSTTHGFLTLVDAYQLRVGGELICKIN